MKQPIAWFLVCSASLALGSAAGCGGDDSSTGTSGSGGSGGSSTGTAGAGGGSAGKGGGAGTGGSAGTGGGGTAGTGGSAGTGGTGGTAGADGGASIQCGNKTCTEMDVGFGTPLPPCCPQGEMNACGLSLMGICLTTTPGTTDTRCPEVTLPTSPMPIPGCCTVLGTCGADLNPLGCNDLSGLLGGTPIPCGPDAGPPPPPPEAGPDVTPPPPADAGTMDSGGTDTRGDATDSSTTDGPSEGGRSDGGVTDASGDRSG